MTRRELLSSVFLAPAASQTLGAAVMLDTKSGRVRWIQKSSAVEGWRVPAGSTIKPFTLLTLLRSGLLKPHERVMCRRSVRVDGLRLDCSHPTITVPLDVSGVLAYFCNSATAQWASRLGTGELAQSLNRFEWHADLHADLLLQALGERAVTASALEMAHAYRRLTMLVEDAGFAPILAGLEGAVDFGTAQNAQVTGLRIAGKTGTVRTESGTRVACFAGWAPSRAPEVVVAVVVQGISGAAAAAPLASQLFRRYSEGQF